MSSSSRGAYAAQQEIRLAESCREFSKTFNDATASLEQKQYYSMCTLHFHPLPSARTPEEEMSARTAVGGALVFGLLCGALGYWWSRDSSDRWFVFLFCLLVGPVAAFVLFGAACLIKWVVFG